MEEPSRPSARIAGIVGLAVTALCVGGLVGWVAGRQSTPAVSKAVERCVEVQGAHKPADKYPGYSGTVDFCMQMDRQDKLTDGGSLTDDP